MTLLVEKSGHLIKFIYFLETKELPTNLKQQFKLFHAASVVSESVTKIITQKKKKKTKPPPPSHPPSTFALNTALRIVLILIDERSVLGLTHVLF